MIDWLINFLQFMNGQVNFAFGEVKMEVSLASEISLSSLVGDNVHSKTISKLMTAR